jgi:hypothetical protein
MKPKIFLIALLLVALGATAHAQNNNPLTAVRFSENIAALSISDNLTVVLTEGTSSTITIEGNANSIAARMSDGHLSLEASDNFYAGKTIIYVPAGLLSKVFLNGTGTVRSATVLKGGKLRIYIGGEGKVNVRSTSPVIVENTDEVYFVKA